MTAQTDPALPAPDPAPLTDLIGAPHGSLADVLTARCRACPNHAFVIADGTVITYATLWDNATRAAGFLTEAGLAGQGVTVASFLGHRVEALWAWLGCQLAGTVHCFLNYEHRGALLADMLALTGAPLLVTDADGWAHLPSLEGTSVRRVLFVEPVPDQVAQAARAQGLAVSSLRDLLNGPAATPGPVTPSDLSALVFSSGSTGRSKAVEVPNNMIVRGAARMAEATGLGPGDVIHFTNPLYHIVGQMHVVVLAIVAGATLALYPRFSRSRFWQQVAEARITYFGCFSNVMRYLLSAPERPEDAQTTLRYAMVAQAGQAERARFAQRFGVEVVDSYGMTEGEPLTLPAPGVMPAGSCGRVNPDFDIGVMDDAGRLLPVGERGIIVFRPRVPDIMMKGYRGDPVAAVAAWRDLWFHTQDIGYLDGQGFLYYVERLKFTIRRRGENIIPAELEQAVRAHPGVEDCVAVGLPVAGGEEDIRLIVRPVAGGETLDEAAILRHCEAHLARFMVPQQIMFVDSLPYTPAGKIDRVKLAQMPA